MVYGIDEELVAKTSDGPKHLERNQPPRRNHRGDFSATRTAGLDEILDHPSIYFVPIIRPNDSYSFCEGTTVKNLYQRIRHVCRNHRVLVKRQNPSITLRGCPFSALVKGPPNALVA